MKKKDLALYVNDYTALFPSDWTYHRTIFVRKVGSWIQEIYFAPHEALPKYSVSHSVSFLRQPRRESGVLKQNLIQPLRAYSGQILWVQAHDHKAEYSTVFRYIAGQFTPSILHSFSNQDIEQELIKEAALYDLWSARLTLFLLYAERNAQDLAEEQYKRLEAKFSERLPDVDWAVEYTKLCSDLYDLFQNDPMEFKRGLARNEKLNWERLKVKPLDYSEPDSE